jgi:PAS domain S-box-containing protein
VSKTWEPLRLFDAMPQRVAVYAPDGTIVYFNAAALRILGVALEDIVGTKIWERYPHAVGEEFHRTFEHVAATGVPASIDHFYAPSDQWYRSQLHLIDGLVHVVSTEITVEKRALLRLSALNEASRAFSVPDHDVRGVLSILAERAMREVGEVAGATLVTDDGLFLEPVNTISDAALAEQARALFTNTTAIEGTLNARVIASKTTLRLANIDVDALAGTVGSGPAQLLRTLRPRAVVIAPITLGDRVIGTLMSCRVVSANPYSDDEVELLEQLADRASLAIANARALERERSAVVALASANETMNAIITASPAAIVVLDLDGTVRLWNPAAEQIFGWTASEVVGRFTPVVDPEHEAELRANLAEVARGNAVVGFDARRRTKDRGTIDVALYLGPIVRTDGTLQCVSLAVDVSERKRSEEAALAADRRKDEFLAMLGHELRNPLAPILTALELIRMRGGDTFAREHEVIGRQTRHLARLLDDLLDLSRIAQGKIQIDKKRIDAGAVVARAIETASPLFEERKHRLSVAIAPELFVEADETRLAQVFHNIFLNAAKYTPPGGHIAVRAAAIDDAARIEIEDDGEGMAPEILATVFDPFVQGERRVHRAKGGLGLGLALVHSLVTLHGGTVEAHSAGKGHGSRVTVRLPLAAAAPARRTPSIRVPDAARRRVLVVDDNDEAADILAELLRLAGHEVLVAHDGPTALGAVPAFHPDVALLDIGLPVMDGYELARRIKKEVPAAPRLIALSGYGQEDDRRRSLEAGFELHLVKPVGLAEVLAVISYSPVA